MRTPPVPRFDPRRQRCAVGIEGNKAVVGQNCGALRVDKPHASAARQDGGEQISSDCQIEHQRPVILLAPALRARLERESVLEPSGIVDPPLGQGRVPLVHQALSIGLRIHGGVDAKKCSLKAVLLQ